MSKGWNLIERFSEDIDLAIDRKFFGFEGDISKTQIRKLRKESCQFILVRLMDTEHGIATLQDKELYNNIVAHREKFNPLRGLDYGRPTPDKIKIIPPDTVIKEYERDYSEMTKFMIYGEALKFEDFMKKIIELQNRINNMK